MSWTGSRCAWSHPAGSLGTCVGLPALTPAAEHLLPYHGLLPGLSLAGFCCWVPSSQSHSPRTSGRSQQQCTLAPERSRGAAAWLGGSHLGDVAGSHPWPAWSSLSGWRLQDMCFQAFFAGVQGRSDRLPAASCLLQPAPAAPHALHLHCSFSFPDLREQLGKQQSRAWCNQFCCLMHWHLWKIRKKCNHPSSWHNVRTRLPQPAPAASCAPGCAICWLFARAPQGAAPRHPPRPLAHGRPLRGCACAGRSPAQGNEGGQVPVMQQIGPCAGVTTFSS